MSSSQGSTSRHEVSPKLPLHLDTQSSRHEPPKLSLHSGPLRQTIRKPNRPLQGDSTPSTAAPDVDFTALQLAIDSNRWKEDERHFAWIFNNYLKLVESRKDPPAGFGSEEFFRRVDALLEDDWKPNRPLQGDPKVHASPDVDFTALQLAIDSNQWKEDQHFFAWIFESYLKLVESKKDPPAGFGSDEFFRRVDSLWQDDADRDPQVQDLVDEQIDRAFEEGGRPPRPAPVIPGTEAARNMRLVDYSDSEEDEPSQQGGGPQQPPRQPPPPLLPINQYYTLSSPVNSYVKKFKVHGKAYTLHFQNQDQMTDLQRILIEIFREVLKQAFEEGNPTDLVGVQIRHPSLHKGYYNIIFKPQGEITAERLFAILEFLMDYDDTFNVDDQMDIIFTRIKDTRGGMRAEAKFKHKDFMLKHSGKSTGGRGIFIQVSNQDNLCLARALVVAKAKIDKDTDPEVAQKWESIRKGDKNRQTMQKRMAQQLMRDAGLGDHQGDCGMEEMKKLQDFLEPEYQIKVFSASCANFITFQGKIPSEKVLHIYHDIDEDGNNGHFMVLTAPHILFTKQMWCDKCNKGFDDKKKHKCVSKCYSCFGLTECPLVQWKECTDCNRWFRSEECFQRHQTLARPVAKNKKQKQNWSTCMKIKRCKDCKRLMNYEKMKSYMGVPVHKCGLYFCRTCQQDHKEGTEECFMQPIVEKKKKKKEEEGEDDPNSIDNLVRDHEMVQDAGLEDMDDMEKDFLASLEELTAQNGLDVEDVVEDLDGKGTKIFFDFECRQEKVIGENQLGPVFVHEPNLCVVTKVCNLCKDQVRNRLNNCCKSCGVNKKIFWGESCREEFCKWLFSVDNRGSIAIAHNSKGYDSQFLIQYLIKETLIPQIISKGLSIMMLQYGEVKVLDSLNFLPMGLSQLPKAFGECELKKGYFPHKFNKEENMDYVGPWPDAWYYDPGNMKGEQRSAFYKWYCKQLGKEFDFRKEILQYCESDVDILMKCCLKFEDLFFKVTGVKPFDVAVTIASACMHVFRKNFLKIGSIGLVPNGGYRRRENQSLQALRWLKWISEESDLEIQHARNGGEKRIGNYKADGYDGTKVYEFHGCVWHGCPKCYRQRDKKVPQSDRTLEDAYQATLTKMKYIKDQGYELVEMWECELRKELKQNKRMRDFFAKLEEIPEPLDHREALRGGRTNATRLYYRCRPGEYMSYVDVCSLYPWGVKYTRFPVGHPQIITENFKPIKAGNNPYFGLIKCTILPPKKLLHPLLPYKANGKLLFPLCKKCAETQRQGYCTHSDKDRALTSTWVSTEVDKALALGYQILSVAEVWHYKETDQYDGKDENTGLFTRYINCFMKLKIEASGWPPWVKTEEDKDKFILECEEREGIKLDPENIEKNAGLRSLAKICLNSFWGKFGQRSNMSKDVFIFDPAKFAEIVFDESNVVENIRVLTDEVLYVTYKKEEEHAELMSHTNPVIAAFTTANCRLRLYEELEKLQGRVCYFDTDSVIYITGPGDVYHPKLGAFLGDMTDELADYGPGSKIVEFVSGGPKNYAFKVKTAAGKYITIVKIRGFTLNYHAAARLNMRNLRRRVFDFVKNGDKSKISVVQPQIGRSVTREVVTKDVKKDYGITYDKRWVLNDFSTLAYGTCEN